MGLFRLLVSLFIPLFSVFRSTEASGQSQSIERQPFTRRQIIRVIESRSHLPQVIEVESSCNPISQVIRLGARFGWKEPTRRADVIGNDASRFILKERHPLEHRTARLARTPVAFMFRLDVNLRCEVVRQRFGQSWRSSFHFRVSTPTILYFQ